MTIIKRDDNARKLNSAPNPAPPQIARFAARYCELGLALTWTPRGQKGPRHAGWNLAERAITDPAAALDYWSTNPAQGVAALLAPSGLVSLDVDDERYARVVLERLGVDVHLLREESPCIVGRHYQLVFTAPEIPLRHRSVTWPKEDNPRTSSVLFEFRAGNITATLPPTIHPGTGQPYRWENPPREGFPPLPARLLELWTDWPETQHQATALCPWAPPIPDPPAPARTERKPQGESVIDAFNAAHDVGAVLENHGYVRRGKRFSAPGSSHAPGITLLDNGKVFCFHAGDPLHGEHACDAFDAFRILNHGGDFRSAVRAAAQALGLDRERAA
jgi:putative DNA primase/helicase